MPQDPNIIMLDQLVRVIGFELVKAFVWVPLLILALRLGVRER